MTATGGQSLVATAEREERSAEHGDERDGDTEAGLPVENVVQFRIASVLSIRGAVGDNMDDVREAVEHLLADKPDVEAVLEALLELDAERENWEFDDAPVDSGLFGELVSRDIVEKRGDGYALTDPPAVRGALTEEEVVEDTEAVSRFRGIDAGLPSVDWRAVAALAGTLSVVLAFRLISLPAVFRDSDVVFLSNDPYFYRYWLSEMLVDGGLTIPEAITTGEPLMLVTLGSVAAVFGGGPEVANQMLAWYPVVAALVTATLVYVVTTWLSDDRRVGLAAVVMLAVTPVHAYRTALGFGDHHAFDYVWVALSLLALVALARVDPDRDRLVSRKTAGWTTVLGLAVAAQALSWNAGPLLSAPIGLYVVARVAADLFGDRDPVPGAAPVVVALLLGFAVVAAVHAGIGWQTEKIVLGVGMLAAGSIVALGVGVAVRRAHVSPRNAVGAVLASIGALSVVAWVASPRVRAEFVQLVLKVGQEDIAEVQSLFNARQGGLVAPFFFFGFLLFVALPYGAWAAWRGVRGERPEWLVPASYLGVFLVLAVTQVRFAGQLSYPVAVFAGLGFVHLAAWVDVLERGPAIFESGSEGRGRPRSASKSRLTGNGRGKRTISVPAPRSFAYLLALFVMVGGLGAVLTPVRADNLTYDDAQYEAAQSMTEYSEQHDIAYPENNVLSWWGDNRMYNWFVNGEARSYAYARTNYEGFLQSKDGGQWYREHGERTGFVVTEDSDVLSTYPDDTLYATLQRQNGNSLGNYRMVYRGDGGDLKAYAVVPGATITGRAPANETITVRKDVSVGGESFTWEKQVQTTMNGWYAARVPYSGSYTVSKGDPIHASDNAVSTGKFVTHQRNDERSASWSFDEGRGDVAFDRQNGQHGRIYGADWVAGENGRALQFSGNDYVEVPNSNKWNDTGGFTLSVWFKLNDTVDYKNDVRYSRIVAKAPSSPYRNTSGYQIALINKRLGGLVGNGKDASMEFTSNRLDNTWHHAVLTWNGSVLKMVLDGHFIGSASFESRPDTNHNLIIGSSSSYKNGFVGRISGVKYYNHSINVEESNQTVIDLLR